MSAKQAQTTNTIASESSETLEVDSPRSFSQSINENSIFSSLLLPSNEQLLSASSESLQHDFEKQYEPSLPADTVNQKKEVLLSGAAGAISYQMGYLHGVSQIIPNDVLKTYRYGGVSAGSCVAGFFVMSLYSDKNMKYWYKRHVRFAMVEAGKHIFGCRNVASNVIGIAQRAYREARTLRVPLDGTFHLYVSLKKGFFSYKPHLVDKFPCEQIFSEALSASCAIPFVTTEGASTIFQGQKAVDGGVSRPVPWRDFDSEVIFLDALPESLRQKKNLPKNLKVIGIAQHELKFPSDFWLWGGDHADQLFLQGYLQAFQQADTLKSVFGVVDSKICEPIMV